MQANSADEYFHAIEEVFIRLRGAPLLLSPADWQTARSWYEQEIPLELVEGALEEVFARLRLRDPERRIHSLRYCAPAVEEAWREVLDLGATEGRLDPVPMDVAARLESLIARLPADLPGRAELAAEVSPLGGDAEAVESRLQEIEERFLVVAAGALRPAIRKRLEERVDRALRRARSRMAAPDIGELERRLLRDFTRQELGLPPLSLFVSAAPGSDESVPSNGSAG